MRNESDVSCAAAAADDDDGAPTDQPYFGGPRWCSPSSRRSASLSLRLLADRRWVTAPLMVGSIEQARPVEVRWPETAVTADGSARPKLVIRIRCDKMRVKETKMLGRKLVKTARKMRIEECTSSGAVQVRLRQDFKDGLWLTCVSLEVKESGRGRLIRRLINLSV